MGDGMGKFLIQTVNGQIRHDFCFGALEALEYQNWYRPNSHEYALQDTIPKEGYGDYIPIGSIQFVQEFLSVYHGRSDLRPIGIPPMLQDNRFVKRELHVLPSGTDLRPYFRGTSLFVKTLSRLKGFTGVITENELPSVPQDEDLLVSECVDIDSEWRAFVFRGTLVGLRNYLGDFTLFPDVPFIRSCIGAYKDAPPAYTLDVGINADRGTFVIEVHNFYSCGLYGFSDYQILPQMFAASFKHLVQHGY